MKRILFSNAVHFKGHGFSTLCGYADVDLLGNPQPLSETSDPVTCRACATLYCRIKNAPWNEVHGATLDAAIYDAVKEDADAGTPLQ